MTDIAIAVGVLLLVGPLTLWAIRFARKHRRVALGAASLLLLFGLNATADPPPPPRIEAADPEQEEAKNDEPK